MIQPSRRGFITGLIAFAAAPAIVRASSLMPVKAMLPDLAWLEEDVIFTPYGRAPSMFCLPGAKELRGHLERFLRRAPPVVEFDKIDLTDPLWAMRKE